MRGNNKIRKTVLVTLLAASMLLTSLPVNAEELVGAEQTQEQTSESTKSEKTVSGNTESANSGTESSVSGNTATGSVSDNNTEEQPAVIPGQYKLEDYVVASNCSVSINEEPISQGMEIKAGDDVEFGLNWTISNQTMQVKAGTVFTYALPGGISWEESSGTIYAGDGSTVYGTYVISGDMVTLTYTSDMDNDVTGGLVFTGKVSSFAGTDGSSDPETILFPGGIVCTVKPLQVTAAISVDKKMLTPSDTQRANGIRDFLVKVSSTGKNTNVTVTDTMGSDMTYSTGSAALYTDADCTKAYTGTYQIQNAAAGAAESSFTAVIAQMSDGQTLYLKYGVQLAGTAYSDYWQNRNDSKIMNTVQAQSTQDVTGAEKKVYLNFATPSIRKSVKEVKDGVITWTLSVEPGEYADLAGTVLQDALPDGVTFIGMKVYTKDAAGDSYVENTATGITWDALSSEAGYVFPAGSSKYYQIEYTTSINDVELLGRSYTNTLNYKLFGIWTGKETATAHVGIGNGSSESSFTKQCLGRDKVTGNINWVIQVKAPKDKDLTNAVLTDVIGDGHTLVENSIGIYTDQSMTAKLTDLTGITINDTVNTAVSGSSTVAGTGFTIDFAKISAGTTYYIGYSTKISQNPGTTTFANQAGFQADHLDYATKDASYKYHLTKGLADSTYSSMGRYDWKLTLSSLQNAGIGTDTRVTVTDTATNMALMQNVPIQVMGSDGIDYSQDVAVSSENGTLTFQIAGKALTASLAGTTLTVTYSMQVDDLNRTVKCSNTAQLHLGDDAESAVTKTVTYTGSSQPVDKSAIYTTDTAPYVEYEIKVNPAALTLNGGNAIKLTDTMGSKLLYAQGSLTINGGKVTVDSDYQLTFGEDNSFTITVPDKTALVIRYKARLTLAVGTDLTKYKDDVTNTCVLAGIISNNHSDKTSLTGKVKRSRAYTDSTTRTLTIYKYGNQKRTEALSGVGFTVEKLTVDSDWKVTGTANIEKLTTDTEGVISQNLRADSVYRITETKALEGYVLDTTPHYIIFAGVDAAKYDNYENLKVYDEAGNAYQPEVIPAEEEMAELAVNNDRKPDDTTVSHNDPGTPENPVTPENPGNTVTTDGHGNTGSTGTTGYVLGAYRNTDSTATDHLTAILPDNKGEVLGESRSPKTSDNTKALLWLLVMGGSGAGLAALIARKKKKKDTSEK